MNRILSRNLKLFYINAGFSWIEFILVTILVAILSIIAIPKLYNFTDAAKSTALQAILSTVRTDISTFATKQKATTGNLIFPTLEQLQILGVVLQEPLLPNPFNGNNAIRDAKGEWSMDDPPVDTSQNEGWNYDEDSGKFWANTNFNGENVL